MSSTSVDTKKISKEPFFAKANMTLRISSSRRMIQWSSKTIKRQTKTCLLSIFWWGRRIWKDLKTLNIYILWSMQCLRLMMNGHSTMRPLFSTLYRNCWWLIKLLQLIILVEMDKRFEIRRKWVSQVSGLL